ncbi:MAG: ribulose phosphate epimerase [Nannocystaceae bacterium]|nr:ribulose phosphate epimerase [bacterium]
MKRHILSTILGAAALTMFTVGCDSDDDPMSSASGDGGETGESGEDPTGNESSNPDPSGTTDAPDPSGTTDAPDPTGDPDTDTSDDTDDPTQGFIEDPDGGGVAVECDVWEDDCPDGEKCMPWANDGGNSWNATRCSPLDENPGQIGDSCMVEGSGVSGIDSCDSRSMCYYVDSETNEGVCVGFCDGSPQAPTCDTGFICTIVNDGVLTLCRAECDPILQDCEGSAACLPATGAEGFTCIIDASGEDGGGIGDPCEFINACDPGNYCANAAVVPDCAGATGCCSEFCDLDDPMCTPAEQECIPWFEEGATPPGYESVGACAIPV